MKIYKDFDTIDGVRNAVLTIGTFDGVHIGHQKILERIKEEARKIDGESVLFTFYPHPKMVLFPDSHNLKLIQTQAQKIEKLRRFGLDNVIVYPFTMEFSRLTAVEFVRDYLVNRLKVKKMVIGYDHQFGKNREGTLSFLKEISEIYGFEVIEIPAQDIDDINVSSTKIRNALLNGDVSLANVYLGEPFEICGKVVRGDSIGRTIGFPTANLEVDSELKLIPANGVYAVQITLGNDEVYMGMMNIGSRPTVMKSDEMRIEVNIFDFSSDIYDCAISVQLLARVRDEIHFESIEMLTEQLKKDEKTVRNYFISSTV